MRIFLSWSGDRSRGIAQVLKESLPLIMNAADPWMSETDIEKGERWSQVLAGVLDQAKVGIFCLTPSNVTKPALLFEAGAISKSVSEARVCVLLDGLKPQNLIWPWTQFQYTKLEDQKDMCKMLADVNGWILDAGEPAVPKERFSSALEMWWPTFQSELMSIPVDSKANPPERSDREMLVEILELQRGQSRSFAGLEEGWRKQIYELMIRNREFEDRIAALMAQNEVLRHESRREKVVIESSSVSTLSRLSPQEKIEAIRTAAVTTLQKAGHETAARAIARGEILLEGRSCSLAVPLRRTMLTLTLNEEAQKLLFAAINTIEPMVEVVRLHPSQADDKPKGSGGD